MKITCQACAAKYTIADDKVAGKVVKIRCKKCGATIVVNGNDQSAGAGAPEPARFDYASQGSQGEAWTVNVADGDQRTMTDQEIGAAYHAAVVTDETFCWKDGMSDWLPLREIEPLYALCTSTRAGAPPDNEDEGATKIQESGASMFGDGGRAAPAPAYSAEPAGNGAAFTDAAPLAARRDRPRAGADLFSSAAQAGSEEDVMTSAPQGMPQAHDDGGALTGARNENSVLFSLNALTSKGPGGGPAHMDATSEASGLIDIRQLSSQIGMGDSKKKRSGIDDIMNLGGGGAFAPSLGAPVLSAPPIEEYAPPPPEPGAAGGPAAGKSRMLILGAAAAGVLVIVGAIGAAVLLMRGGKESDTDKAAASALAATSAVPSGSVAAAAPDPTAAASDSSQASATPPPAPTTAATTKATAAAATTAAASAA